jgi:hypothetical protein
VRFITTLKKINNEKFKNYMQQKFFFVPYSLHSLDYK